MTFEEWWEKKRKELGETTPYYAGESRDIAYMKMAWQARYEQGMDEAAEEAAGENI